MPKKGRADKKIQEDIEAQKLESYLKDINAAFYSQSMNYKIYNEHFVTIEKSAYSFSSGLIKNVNDVVFQIIEKDFTLSDKCTKEEYTRKLITNNGAFSADGSGRIDIFSLLLLKDTEESLESVTNAVKETIERQNLFNTDERESLLNPINDLYLYGMTSAFSSIYMRNLNNNFYRETFNRMNRSSRVIMDYFIMGMALKIAENQEIHTIPVPQRYIRDLSQEIFGSRDAYRRSRDNFFAEKALLEKEFNEEKMN